MSRSRQQGFTLIEVMVSLAILGMGLASLFTSQVGAIKVAQHARSTTVATLLARCKMGEIEEKVLRDGIPFDTFEDHDECCEDMEHDGYECDWSIQRIVLPEQQLDDGDEEGGLMDALGVDEEDDDVEAEDLASPDALGEDTVGSVLGGGGAGGLMDMITGMSLPLIKPLIEEQVRRANVTVQWREGDREMSFDVTQFLVSEVGAPPPDDGSGAAASTGSSSNSGSSNSGGEDNN